MTNLINDLVEKIQWYIILKVFMLTKINVLRIMLKRKYARSYDKVKVPNYILCHCSRLVW